jgi:hypothetical protein
MGFGNEALAASVPVVEPHSNAAASTNENVRMRFPLLHAAAISNLFARESEVEIFDSAKESLKKQRNIESVCVRKFRRRNGAELLRVRIRLATDK